MAKIKFGAIVTDASGKLGGHVFSKNRAGSYLRTKASPTNPRSTFQMWVRALFAQITSAWSGLTQEQRNSFNSKVDDYQKTNVFGDLKSLSGKALFQKLNNNLLLTDQEMILTCPSPSPYANIALMSAVGDVSGNAFDVATLGTATGEKVVISATPLLSQGTKFVKNDLRQIAVVSGGVDATINIFASYTARFGALVAGANIMVGLHVVNAQGIASPMQLIKADISA
jgi:phage-related tail protein